MNNIHENINNYAIKYAKEVIQQQRIIRIFEEDLNYDEKYIESKINGLYGVDTSRVKMDSYADREHKLIEMITEKDAIIKKRDSLSKITKRFNKNLEKLSEDERKIIEYELNYLYISNEIMARELTMNKEDVQRIEASALLKVGCSLLGID